MLPKIVLGIAVIIMIVVGYAAMQPEDYVISRWIVIKATAEKIFPHLNNQKLAEKWGPWPEVDPNAKMNYSGPDEGVGAKASWDSSGQLGTGSATIIESTPNQRVKIQLEYTKPMAMKQVSDYIIEERGSESNVTWRVEGKNSLFGRVMCLFMDMDKVVGSMFEKGLRTLRELSNRLRLGK